MRPFHDGRHPTATELLQQAEGQLGRRATLYVKTASHIGACKRCKTEVDRIRETLSRMEEATALEPDETFAAQVKLAARHHGCRDESWARRLVGTVQTGRRWAYAAGLLALTAIVFAKTYTAPTERIEGDGIARRASVLSLDRLRRATPEEELLTRIVMSPLRAPQDAWERERRRAVLALDAEISEGLAALERNPSSVRAQQLVSVNRARMQETLKTLYVERSL